MPATQRKCMYGTKKQNNSKTLSLTKNKLKYDAENAKRDVVIYRQNYNFNHFLNIDILKVLQIYRINQSRNILHFYNVEYF